MARDGSGDEPDPDRPGHPTRKELREELVESGELVPVEVEGVRGKRFVLRERSSCSNRRPSRRRRSRSSRRSVHSWDRDLLRPLYGFDYVWEVYVPGQAQWGYYVLPVLFRDRLVGRIEPRIDRSGKRVQVIGAWWEDGFEPRRAEGFVEAMRAALRAYLGFAGATRIEWAEHLGKEKRLFPARPSGVS